MKNSLIFFGIYILLGGCGQPPSYILRQWDMEESGLNSTTDIDGGPGTTSDANPGNSGDGNPNTKPPTKDDDVDIIAGGSSDDPSEINTAESCEKIGKKLVAPNVVFLVDNSGSNLGSGGFSVPTDCPQKSGNQCLGEPIRKLTFMKVAQDLQNVDIENAGADASSYLSVVSFSSNAQERLALRSTGSGLNFDSLRSMMDFTKTPNGYTSYLAALKAGKNIFQRSTNIASRPKVIVKITDGFPTDTPQSIFDEASALRSSGVKIITVVYSRQEQFDQIAQSWAQSTTMSEADRNWVIGKGRDSLIVDISDHALLVKDVNKLPEVVSYMVQKTGLECR